MRLTRLPLALGLVLLLAGTSRAQLLLTLTPSGLSGAPGTTLTFAATLVNTGASELFLNGNTFTLSSVNLTLDDTKFFANAPLSLLGGASFSGEIFDITIAPAAVPNLYSGSFTVQGGASNTASETLATGNFQVTVTAPQQADIPEPGTWALMASGLLPLARAALCRRGRAWKEGRKRRSDATECGKGSDALRVLADCCQQHIRVPEDMPVVDFDGCPTPDEDISSLTILRAPRAGVARTADRDRSPRQPQTDTPGRATTARSGL